MYLNHPHCTVQYLDSLFYIVHKCVQFITDIDECALKTDTCEQECENTPGGYNCNCYPGFSKVNFQCELGE